MSRADRPESGNGPRTPAPGRGPRMGLWRLEWLRLVRTRRWLVLLGVQLFFGLTSPVLTARTQELLERFGGGVRVEVPVPTTAAGIASYVGNAQQLGLLVVLVVAALAVAGDHRPEAAAFLRTRVRRPADLVVPRVVVVTAAVAGALTAGMLAAWYATAVLIGPVPAGAVLAGLALLVLYHVLAVALVTLAAARTRSVAVAAVTTVVTLLLVAALSVVERLRPWLPSELLGAPAALVGGGGAGEYARAALVTAVLAVAATAAAVRVTARQEL